MQPALRKCLAQTGHEFAAKDLPQHRHRQEEGRARMDPARAIGGQPAGRHDAMDVGMMLQPLPPRVQDHQPADGGPEALRVGGDLEQRGRGGAKEEVVHDALVDERQPREHLRHREDDVHVADGQQFLLARRDPVVAGRGEALGAMPIPAAVVREGRLRTPLTAIPMPAQRGRAALDEGPEDASMLAGEPRPMRLQKAIAVSAHDVGHLKGWPRHRLCNRRDLYTVSGVTSAIVSSGFTTPCRWRCDKCR